MSNFKLSSTALFCLLIMPNIAHCLDLGKVDVYSGLHENLNSKIALQLSADDLNSKSIVEIAPAEKMLEAGIVFNDNLHKIHIKRAGTSINVFSKTALESPKVDLLLKITSDKEVKYRRVNLNLNELSEQVNEVSEPAELSAAHDANLLSQTSKKKKIESTTKSQQFKKKKVEASQKNQLPKNTTQQSLPIAEVITRQNQISAIPDTLTSNINNEPVSTNTTETDAPSQVNDAVEQQMLNNSQPTATIKAPTVVEQPKLLEKFNSFDLIAFLIGILSLLGYQRFKRAKVLLPQPSQQAHDANNYEFTYNAKTALSDVKIDLNYGQNQTLDRPSNAKNSANTAKTSPFTTFYIPNNTDDFDFDFDFELPTKNKPHLD
ncbi:MAG: hypothetical protein QX191_04295 [Methylococcaceae bacterium]